MTKTTNVNIRIDEKLKHDAEVLFSELGINMSSAMNMFLKHSVRYGGIPFEVRIAKPNKETIAAVEDVKQNRNLSKSFNSIDSLIDDLNA